MDTFSCTHKCEENSVEYTCHHPVMTEEQQRLNKCLQADSAAVQVLKAIVIDKVLLRDVKQMERFKHTGMPCLQNHVLHSSSCFFTHLLGKKQCVHCSTVYTMLKLFYK